MCVIHWLQVLGLPEDAITNTGNFMRELGGTSLDYYTLISEIGEAFGIVINYGGINGEDFSYCLNDFEKIVMEALQQDVL